ncbi:MAG TPA: hypothetical protein VF549_21120 [Solirubrobacteraceae bacterium]|jgi:hypothetical protein
MLPRLALLCALLFAVVPATASADPFDDVFADYQKDGKIDPCAHSPEELQQAKGDIPNDIDQYAPDFPAALDAAMEDRASGKCGGGGDGSGGAAAPGTTTPGGTTAAPAPAPGATTPNAAGQTPGPPGTAQPTPQAADGAIANAAARDDSDSDFPAPLVALLVAGGLLALSLLVWGLFRFFAWEPAWLPRARHSVAEAGWRTSGAWADFTDWLRTRRPAR